MRRSGSCSPHNVAFWVYLLGVGGGALTMLRYFGLARRSTRRLWREASLLFGLYLVPWLLLLRHHNRFTSQPAGLLAAGFVWGGVAATFWIALPANTALLEIWAKVGGTSFALRLGCRSDRADQRGVGQGDRPRPADRSGAPRWFAVRTTASSSARSSAWGSRCSRTSCTSTTARPSCTAWTSWARRCGCS